MTAAEQRQQRARQATMGAGAYGSKLASYFHLGHSSSATGSLPNNQTFAVTHLHSTTGLPDRTLTVEPDPALHVSVALAPVPKGIYRERRGGLSPMQRRRAEELLRAHLDGKIALATLARPCRSPTSACDRASRIDRRLPVPSRGRPGRAPVTGGSATSNECPGIKRASGTIPPVLAASIVPLTAQFADVKACVPTPNREKIDVIEPQRRTRPWCLG
jgi:hypothetical protein